MSEEIKNKLVPKLRFPEFKDSLEWEEITLSETLNAESSTLAQNKLKLLDSGYPVYGASGFIGYIGTFKQKKEYVAIIKDGSGVGKLFFYKGNSSVLGTLTYLKSKDEKTYSISCLYYLLQTIDFSSYVKGSGIPHIYSSDYLKVLIGFPNNLIEQQKIADCLSSLDELITAQNQKLEALKAHKKGLMQQLFPAEGENVPELRFAEFMDDGEWEIKPIGEIAKVTTGNKDTQNKIDNGLFPFFVRSQTIERINSYSFNGEAILTSGDGVGVGKNFHYINGKFDFHQRVYCIYEFSEDVGGKFLYLYFSEHFYKRVMKMNAKGSVDSVRMGMITEMPICLPNLTEQKKIANCLSSLDELITAQTEKIATLKTHKKGLMQQLFPAVNE